MMEETTPTPADLSSDAASTTGGSATDSKKAADLATSQILRDKEGDGLRPRNRRRRKVSYLTTNKIDVVDYKEIAILKRFTNDRGKMYPTRQTGNTAKQQRMIAMAIRRAREMALLPFVSTEIVSDRGVRTREDRKPREPRGE